MYGGASTRPVAWRCALVDGCFVAAARADAVRPPARAACPARPPAHPTLPALGSRLPQPTRVHPLLECRWLRWLPNVHPRPLGTGWRCRPPTGCTHPFSGRTVMVRGNGVARGGRVGGGGRGGSRGSVGEGGERETAIGAVPHPHSGGVVVSRLSPTRSCLPALPSSSWCSLPCPRTATLCPFCCSAAWAVSAGAPTGESHSSCVSPHPADTRIGQRDGRGGGGGLPLRLTQWQVGRSRCPPTLCLEGDICGWRVAAGTG